MVTDLEKLAISFGVLKAYINLTLFGSLLDNTIFNAIVVLCSFVGAQLQNRETNLSRNQGTYSRQRIDQKCFSIQQ